MSKDSRFFKKCGTAPLVLVAVLFLCLILFVPRDAHTAVTNLWLSDADAADWIFYSDSRKYASILAQVDQFGSEMPIILLQTGGWEDDFVLRDLLPSRPYNLLRLNGRQISDLRLYQAAFPAPSSSQSKFILIFSSNLPRKYRSSKPQVELMSEVVKYLRPRVVVHLSDEKGDKPEYMQLATLCRLYLRQYFHAHYPVYECTVHIPLGYTLGAFDEPSVPDPDTKAVTIAKSKGHSSSSESVSSDGAEGARDYVWSFIGNQQKKDRPEMIRTLQELPGAHYLGDASVPAREMAEILRRSVFAPSGRGHVVLDTTRLSDASACGAIPVVVGAASELASTFKHYRSPPWLFAESWVQAKVEMQRLLDSPPRVLADRRSQLLRWWTKTVLLIRHNVSEALS